MRTWQAVCRTLGLVGLLAAMASISPAAVPHAVPYTAPRAGGSIKLNDLIGQPRSLISPSKDEAADQQPTVRVELSPATAKPGDIVTLTVSVTLPPESYTYAINPDAPVGTRIEVTYDVGVKPQGEFVADRAPIIVQDPVLGKPLQKFEGAVTWKRSYVVSTDLPQTIRLEALLGLTYCNPTGCHMFSQKLQAKLGGSSVGPANNSAFTNNSAITNPATNDSTAGQPLVFSKVPKSGGAPGPAALTFQLSPAQPKPGDVVTLAITMTLKSGWHTYSITQPEVLGTTTTVIDLKSARGLRPLGEGFKPDPEPESDTSAGSAGLGPRELHHGHVTWTRTFQYEPSKDGPGFGVSGSIHYGICDQGKCLPPRTEPFALGDLRGAAELHEVAAKPDSFQINRRSKPAEGGIWFYVFTAFIGGVLLNVMPCVLPVLAIKVLSFVQQAGESRSRVFLLNVAYTGGVMAVFLILATLAVSARASLATGGGFSWGGLFAETRFNLVMACLVFAMGLSLLGVFEIPVPGMIGSAAGAQQQEGLLGAFLTGIFATLLATPCLGPFMGAAIFWAIRQPPVMTLLVFAVMGLGMASPYLVLGLFPRLVRWLPKPGTWMIRLKEFAGFVLFGSVIFIIYYTDKQFTIPLLVMLLGVSLGLWMIGNLYDINSHVRHKMTVRLIAVGLTAIICWFGYGLSAESKYRLPWEPFSESRIAALVKQDKTILVDFTADWCGNCRFNEYVALNTKATYDLVKRHGVVALLADFTKQPPEIKRWLAKFEQDGVPLTVIFPAGRQSDPIVLTGPYTQGTLLEKLREAVGESPSTSAMAEAPRSSVR